MSTPDRIRWEYADGGMDGYVGTLVPPVFRITDAAPAAATWVLMAEFPGDAILGDDMEELKAQAEGWLARFVASIGAVFPDSAGQEPLAIAGAITDRDPLPSGLLPAERLAASVARQQLQRGENPPINITAVLLLAVDRLAPIAAKREG